MALVIPVFNVCEKCGHKHLIGVQVTLNALLPEDVELVSTDKLNVVYCPKCSHKSRAGIAVFYENRTENTFIWYRPCERDDEFFLEMSGILDKLNAKITKSWHEFKTEVQKAEQSKKTKVLASDALKKIRQHQQTEDKLLMDAILSVRRLAGGDSDKAIYVLRNGTCTYATKNYGKGFLILIIIMLFCLLLAATGK